MGKIVPLGMMTKLDLPVERILEEAKGNLDGAVLIGWDKEGELYAASSYADGGTIMWLLEQAKLKVLGIE